MKSYIKTFLLRLSMQNGLEMQAPVDRHISRALAFFLRVMAISGLIFVIGKTLHWLRWW